MSKKNKGYKPAGATIAEAYVDLVGLMRDIVNSTFRISRLQDEIEQLRKERSKQ